VDGLSENSISDVTKDAFAAKFTTQAELDAYDASGQIMTDYGETPILNKIQTSIEKICAWGVASGYDNGSTSRKFGRSHPITRGEFLKMVINSSIKATGKEIPKDEAAYKVPVYKFAAECNKDADILFLDHDDLAKKNENGTYRNRDFFPYVNYALRPDSGDPIMYGFLTKGTEGYSCENESTYGINRPITREQAAKILYKVYQDAKGVNDTDGVCDNDKLDINGSPAFFADYSNKLKWWSCEYAHKAGKYLMKDYTGISENRFLYDNYLTRWQMAVSSCNLLSTLSSHIVSCGQ
jgi:hypothetical protein